MTALIGLHELSKSFGSKTLFKNISFTIGEGNRIGLVGPNGSGKSTLLKILMGLDLPDSGNLSYARGIRVGYAAQDPEFADDTVLNIMLQDSQNPSDLEEETKAKILLSKAQFQDIDQNAKTLSGGWKKRLDIVRALMQEPDLLLLDEPTNHLDLEGIFWLEKFLLREKISYVVVSHDRYFLEKVCTKVIELNSCYPEGLFIVEGNMSSYYERKETFLLGQEKQAQSLRSIVRDEVDWLRRSPKARTTKSVARIQRANELIDELSDVQKRNTTTKVRVEFSASERETRRLLVAKNLSKSYGVKTLFKAVDFTLSPGSCLGIMGANGTGKSTLLKMLAGQIVPDTGTIKYATDLKLVYFDQHREKINPDLTLRDALCPVGEMVLFRGQYIHVNGWAKKFLFSPDRLSLPVRFLSGGERARILLANLMLEPADILFLDEPTNDLDIQTLEVIEESLQEFAGAVVLISHDRCLVDRVCTQILGLGTDQDAILFADYAQWEQAASQKQLVAEKKEVKEQKPKTSTSKKLSYNEQRELQGIESEIERAERTVSACEEAVNNPNKMADATFSLEAYTNLSRAQSALDTLYARWQELIDKTVS